MDITMQLKATLDKMIKKCKELENCNTQLLDHNKSLIFFNNEYERHNAELNDKYEMLKIKYEMLKIQHDILKNNYKEPINNTDLFLITK